jgi:hypothetical protein
MKLLNVKHIDFPKPINGKVSTDGTVVYLSDGSRLENVSYACVEASCGGALSYTIRGLISSDIRYKSE